MRRKRAYRSSGLLRSLTLLRTFLIASAVILAVGAIALSSTLSNDLRAAALDDNARDVGAYVDASRAELRPRGSRRRDATGSPTSRRRFDVPEKAG